MEEADAFLQEISSEVNAQCVSNISSTSAGCFKKSFCSSAPWVMNNSGAIISVRASRIHWYPYSWPSLSISLLTSVPSSLRFSQNSLIPLRYTKLRTHYVLLDNISNLLTKKIKQYSLCITIELGK